MSNAIVQTQGTAIATPHNLELTRDQIELAKRTVAVGATDDEFAMFLYQAKRTGLDPLSRQIHFVKRQGKGTIQTGIDGYRLIADRTGLYAGSDDYRFDEGLSSYEHGESDRGFPKTATVTVYKIVGGQRAPFVATARWDEYYPGDKQGFMWRKMPYLMLGKCAEALALRKAFPAELSGVYTNEEMEQAGGRVPADLDTLNAIRDELDGMLANGVITQGGHAAYMSDNFVKCQLDGVFAEKQLTALRKHAAPVNGDGEHEGDVVEAQVVEEEPIGDDVAPSESDDEASASEEQVALAQQLLKSHVFDTERGEYTAILDGGVSKDRAIRMIDYLKTELETRKAAEKIAAQLREDVKADDVPEGVREKALSVLDSGPLEYPLVDEARVWFAGEMKRIRRGEPPRELPAAA